MSDILQTYSQQHSRDSATFYKENNNKQRKTTEHILALIGGIHHGHQATPTLGDDRGESITLVTIIKT